MTARLIVDKQEGLKESVEKDFRPRPPWLRKTASLISYIFHPVFVPVYIVMFMVYVHPYLFAGFNAFDRTRTVIMSVLMYTFFPLVTVLFLKALKFVDSLLLNTQKDRIIPLVACGIWYFWIWYVWRNFPEYPREAVQLALAIWISVSLALLLNIRMKVSLHSISMGIMLGFLLLLAFSQSLNFGFYISVGFIITGLVCSSRLIVSDHQPIEIYGGLGLGLLSMLIAQWVV